MSLSKEDKAELNNFVRCVLNQWYGLQIAIQNGMGGTPAQISTKVNQMIETISGLCSSSKVCKEEITDTLEDLTDMYFDVLFEDGSTDDVATHLWNESRNYLAGDKEKIRSFISSKSNTVIPCPKIASTSDNENEKEDEGDMEVDLPEVPRRGPDEEGWEVPRYGRRKR